MPSWKKRLQDGCIMLATLAAVFALVLLMQQFFKVERLIPMLFVLGVFVVSRSTEGYFWGIAASLIGVLLENGKSFSEERQHALLHDMQKDAEWLIRMVENLLSVTRIDEKRLQIAKVSTVLEELIDSVLVKFYKHYPHQQVEVSIPDEFISIPMDAVLIEQVLMNLMENAVVHARGMKHMCLTVSVENGKAFFSVTDDGCGIAPQRLSSLFTGYLDRDQEVSDGKRTGMGIGLFVCAAIVHAHGGEIHAANLPQGGASFHFVLDMEESNEQ